VDLGTQEEARMREKRKAGWVGAALAVFVLGLAAACRNGAVVDPPPVDPPARDPTAYNPASCSSREVESCVEARRLRDALLDRYAICAPGDNCKIIIPNALQFSCGFPCYAAVNARTDDASFLAEGAALRDGLQACSRCVFPCPLPTCAPSVSASCDLASGRCVQVFSR
jgi:hypothetical protein